MPFQLEKVTPPLRRPPRFHGRAVGGCLFFFCFQSCGIRLRAKISCINMWDVSKMLGNKRKDYLPNRSGIPGIHGMDKGKQKDDVF